MKPAARLRETRTTAAEPISVPQPAIGTSARPMTGDEYIESIRDGREVYLYGDRVKDVTTHPAFRNSVRVTARDLVGRQAARASGRTKQRCATPRGRGGKKRILSPPRQGARGIQYHVGRASRGRHACGCQCASLQAECLATRCIACTRRPAVEAPGAHPERMHV